jgi:hypothetical protein
MGLSTLNGQRLLPAGGFSTTPAVGPDGTLMRNIMSLPTVQNALNEIFWFLPSGGDGGFSESADVVQQTIDGVDTRELWTAYQQAVALRNEQRQPIVDFLTYGVTNPIEMIPQTTGTARFERASEYGLPRAHRPGAVPTWLGFDFDWFDLAARFTWEFLVDATAAQVDAVAQGALEADSILMHSMIMWTLFNNVMRSATINQNPYNVYTFWNGDAEVPPAYKTFTHTAPHNHYLTTNRVSTVVVSTDLDAMWDQLNHHGYNKAEGYELILMVNKAQGDVIRQFRSVANGGTALYDFIPAAGTASFLLPTTLRVGEGQVQPASTLRGMNVIGSYGEFIIIQEDYIPALYMVAFATGGRESVRNPIGLREHVNTQLRGLRLVKGRDPDYPLQESIYQRGFGTGIRVRGAGVIMQIVNSATYTIPTAYNTQP